MRIREGFDLLQAWRDSGGDEWIFADQGQLHSAQPGYQSIDKYSHSDEWKAYMSFDSGATPHYLSAVLEGPFWAVVPLGEGLGLLAEWEHKWTQGSSVELVASEVATVRI